MCKKAQGGVGIRGCWASWPFPTLSHPLFLGIRPWVFGELGNGTNSTHLASLGLACGGLVQGLMRNRLRGCGPADQHFCGQAWQASILTLLTPTPPLLRVGWGSVLPRVLCSAAPCGGWQALPWATGAGRRMSHLLCPPNMFCKDLWNP